ncbi:putative GAF domain-containing protein [Candidozyma auris]|nr:putative GAF domain-containing protein [[Candida] auris]
MRSIVLAYILQFSQAFAANNLSAMGMNWMHSVTPMETEVYQGTMSKVKSNDESIGVVHKLGSMDEFYNASILDLLQDTTNSFIFEKSRDAVYYDRRMRKWYLQTFSSKKPPVKDILVPITWCYDMTAGKGGSIKQSFEVSLSAQQTFGQQVGLENFLQLDGVILSGSFGVSLSEGITYKDAQMQEKLHHADYTSFPESSKREVLEIVNGSYEALSADTNYWVSNLANAASLIWHAYHSIGLPINWVGFYITTNTESNNLVLGPFQGKVACQSIQIGKGVCGMAAMEKRTQCIADVNKFPGHIACDGETKSEIVVPILNGESVVGVLDIDCLTENGFDEVDVELLEALAALISKSNNWSLS